MGGIMYRIIKQNDRYYIQKRTFFIWHTPDEEIGGYYSSPYYSYDTIEEARKRIEWIKALNSMPIVEY